MIRQGVTFWISKSASNSEKIGIKYPIPNEDENTFRMMDPIRDDENNFNKVFEKIISTQNEFLIVNEDNFPLGAYPTKNNIGIEPKIELEMGQFVYTITVPLNNNANNIFDIRYQPGEKVLIGFEIEDIKREGMNPRGNTTEFGAGGRNPRTGGMPGGRRGGGINRMNRSEPLDISLKIQLASK